MMGEFITYRELVKEFICFLKSENAYENYLDEFRKQMKDSYEFKYWYPHINPLARESLRGAINRGLIGEIINHSFCWASTKQGYRYWEKLNMKWGRKICSKKLKIEPL